MKHRRLFSAFALAFAVLLGASCSAIATPTPQDTTLVWDDYTDPDATGFYLYWAPNEDMRSYDDTRRVQIPRNVTQNQLNVITTLPGVKGGKCFRLTAHDAAMNESAFSNEACGWFGIPAPKNLQKR